jgi:uncharacterized protein YjbI with pentapeptide repeats
MQTIRDRNGNDISLDGDLNGVDFDSTNLSGIDLSDKVMEGAMFADADLSRANLESSDLYWAVFFRAKLYDVNLRCARLCGADFALSDLSRADLRGANLGLDNLGGATQLQGANLSTSLVDGTDFTGAKYDSETRFPADFDPLARGMKKVD